jgi:dephospho-CoA kinase
MKLIGIGGTNGSGKDTVGKMLADRHDWLFISSSEDLLIPEVKKRRLPLTRENMSAISTEWRKNGGMGAVVDKALEKFKVEEHAHEIGGLAVASLRHPGEAERIHELGGLVVWVDAEPRVRYERVAGRGQGEKDQKTFQEFVEEQKREMSHKGHHATNNMAAVRDLADVLIENSGDNLEEFKNQTEKVLKDAQVI